jgi:hypothetical protein
MSLGLRTIKQCHDHRELGSPSRLIDPLHQSLHEQLHEMKTTTLCLQAAFAVVLRCIDAAPAAVPLSARASWPDLPFKASGRDIVSSSGSKVVYAGVNWPGAADTMLPEGLQYNSVAGIVSLIKSLDMNVVRLTFAIEMVDDIYDDSPDQSLQATLVKALGQANGTTILDQILEQNPDFTPEMTRLEVCYRA